MQNRTPRIQTSLLQMTAGGADSGKIADAAVAAWRDIDAALSPIIGDRGTAALFTRCLYLMRTDYPWLADAHASTSPLGALPGLRAAFSAQTGVTAASANGALLHTFFDLVTHLIGGSLAERLLKTVWDDSSSDRAVREIS